MIILDFSRFPWISKKNTSEVDNDLCVHNRCWIKIEQMKLR